MLSASIIFSVWLSGIGWLIHLITGIIYFCSNGFHHVPDFIALIAPAAVIFGVGYRTKYTKRKLPQSFKRAGRKSLSPLTLLIFIGYHLLVISIKSAIEYTRILGIFCDHLLFLLGESMYSLFQKAPLTYNYLMT